MRAQTVHFVVAAVASDRDMRQTTLFPLTAISWSPGEALRACRAEIRRWHPSHRCNFARCSWSRTVHEGVPPVLLPVLFSGI